MRFQLQIFDPKLKGNLHSYIFQCFLVFLTLLGVLLVGEVGLHRAVIVAAIGSTSFVLFITPHSLSASPRHVIGGHLIALLVGSAFAAYDSTGISQNIVAHFPLIFDVEAALAVAVSIFLMAATNTEHAPAAGTALGVVIQDYSWELVLFVVSSVVILSFVHTLIRPRLRDLL